MVFLCCSVQHTNESTIGSVQAGLRSTSGPTDQRRPLPTLTILAHPEAGRVGDRAVLGEAPRGKAVVIDRYRPEFRAPGSFSGRPLSDRHLSRRPISLTRDGVGDWRLARDGSATAVAVDGLAVQHEHGFADADLADGVVIELAHRIVLLLHVHTPSDEPSNDDLDLVGASDGMVSVRDEIRRVADLEVGVLIRGETGTGKELVARALHRSSGRPDDPFVAVNLGAIPSTLAASELFGVTRGAFTGATHAQDGCFVRADGGTLLLDEIGEAPAEIQVALLRALETGEVKPIGGAAARKVQTRVVAATDADLSAKIAAGTFREPLLHRLAAFEIWLPPLRQRRDDIGRLLVHFLAAEEASLGDDRLGCVSDQPWIEAGLMARLARFDWPGNVRQLRNVARQLAIGNRGDRCLRSTTAVERLLATPPKRPPAAAVPRRLPSKTDDVEILATLRNHRFEIKKAAGALGISRAALYAWIESSALAHTVNDLDPETIRSTYEALDGNLEEVAARLEVSAFALRRRLREMGL